MNALANITILSRASQQGSWVNTVNPMGAHLGGGQAHQRLGQLRLQLKLAGCPKLIRIT